VAAVLVEKVLARFQAARVAEAQVVVALQPEHLEI
jgi:hypothetical protein